jgi:hypothetical protein
MFSIAVNRTRGAVCYTIGWRLISGARIIGPQRTRRIVILHNWTVAIILEDAPPVNRLATLQDQKDEEVRLGKREIYVAYGAGRASSKLKFRPQQRGLHVS